MSVEYVERRLLDWALRKEYGGHDPAWAPTTIEHRIQTEGCATRPGNCRGDGGMGRIYDRHGHELVAQQRTAQIDTILEHLKRHDPKGYGVVLVAFLDRPGRIIAGVDGAREVGIGRNIWRNVYERALGFVDGGLAVMM